MKLHLFNEVQIKSWIQEISEYHHDLLTLHIPFDKEHLLTEVEVSEILGVTIRTLRTYRNKNYLRYLKLNGRIYFVKILLYVDLVLLCEKNAGRVD